jgi:SpoVK/Ycf46/Vps4 family AAA+-type ATPase
MSKIHKKKNNPYRMPYRIDNYNKFLMTLDNKPFNLNNEYSINNSDIKNDVNYKSEIFIKSLNDYHNMYDKTSNDFINFPSEEKVLHKQTNYQNEYKKFSPITKKDITHNDDTLLNQTNVFISEEVNSICDILNIIEKYKLEPNVKYNIDVRTLHKIKEPLEELNNMIGMKELKNNIFEQILYFIQNLHKNKKGEGDFMHTVIYGNPGTGKTEISKIMGKIFSKLGILENDKFIKVTRADLIAGYLGQTSIKTKEVIKEAIGGVLFIDEAYALGNSEKRDSFAKECIDTLCEALSDHKDKLMVIIAGYEDELKECFFNYNRGLESRFTWRFKTDEYSGEDLYKIFLKKVLDIGWCINDETKITVDWFNKNKDYFKYYGRDIEALLTKIKIAHSKRVFCKEESEKKKITFNDLENGFKIFISNNEIKKRKETEMLKKQIQYSIYC